ncbi:terminase family protein [Escherichia coli]
MTKKKQFIPNDDIINLVTERLKHPDCTYEEKLEYLELLNERERRMKLNKLFHFKPYPYQKQFYDQGAESRFRFLCAATRLGKSAAGAIEFAAHLTGLYDELSFDWKGRRFDTPVNTFCVGTTSDTTRQILQYELLGVKDARQLDNVEFDGEDKGVLGSGSIPLYCIVKDSIVRNGNQVLEFKVRHFDKYGNQDGFSEVAFKSTQQGQEALFGQAKHVIWLDEEDKHCSMEIFEQATIRTTTTKGLVMQTSTPEWGLTDLITHMRENEDRDYYFQKAGLLDAHVNIGGHISDRDIEVITAGTPAHKLKMRLEGEPAYGRGVIFDMDLKNVICDPFVIPDSYKRCAAIDLGNAHRTGITFSAISPEGKVYVYWEYANSGKTPEHYASIIKKADPTIPVILPVDGWQEKGVGITYYKAYHDEGLNVSPIPFYNSITVDGTKHFKVEYGIEEMRVRMLEGNLKIFATCPELIKELGMYSRNDKGEIIKKFDDVVDSARYSILSVIAGRGKPKLSRNNGTDANDWRYK